MGLDSDETHVFQMYQVTIQAWSRRSTKWQEILPHNFRWSLIRIRSEKDDTLKRKWGKECGAHLASNSGQPESLTWFLVGESSVLNRVCHTVGR